MNMKTLNNFPLPSMQLSIIIAANYRHIIGPFSLSSMHVMAMLKQVANGIAYRFRTAVKAFTRTHNLFTSSAEYIFLVAF